MAEKRTQRRLAAILAADVVGYRRIMEQDEAGTLALLKSRRRSVLEPLVAQHQGRVFKFTGDGVSVQKRRQRPCNAPWVSRKGWPPSTQSSPTRTPLCCVSALTSVT